VRVRIFPGGALGNPKTMVDVVTAGIADIGFVLPSYVPGRFPRSSVFELPYIFEGAEQMARVLYENEALFAPDYERFKVLWFLASPLSQCHTTEKPIRKVDDFTGMKIRSAGAVETEGIRRLGGHPIGMPVSELGFALQRGAVEGALTPYAALNSHKLIDVVRHITEINYSGALMAVLMNRDKWNALPDYAKAAIDRAATPEFGMKAAAAFDREDAENQKAAAAAGIQIHRLPEAEAAKMRAALRGIWEDWATENQSRFSARKILDAVLASAQRAP
jgi:TRAP-type C4-dicarboxylate transport system substrate-binding protein